MRQLHLFALLIFCTVMTFGQTKKISTRDQILESPDPITQTTGESILSDVDAGQIPVQGRLTDGGAPVNGTREFVFTIVVDTATTWTETHPSVQVVNGFYSIVLGSITSIPAYLFEGEDSREVTITVDGTALSPITIYSPFGTDVGRFYIKDATDSISTALSAINEGPGTGGTEGTRRGIYAAAQGPGNNVGVFAYSENGRNINGQTELTDPEVYTSGQLSSLYGNSNVGGRALQGQYTATGPGHGIGLSGYAGGEGMNWGVWGRANALSDSMQVGGYMEAFGPGAGDQYGVWGQASGENSSRNIGVYGTAFGSPGENWAGWFDGQVSVQDGAVQYFESGGNSYANMGSRSLIFRGEDGEANAYLGNNWLNGGAQTNNRGALVLWGDTTTRDALGGVDIRRAALTVADDGFGKDVGRLELMAPVTGDNLLVELGINSDSTTYKGSLILKGSDGSFFEITSDGIPGGGEGPQDMYLLTDSVSSWMTFDAGFGLSGQINFSGPAGGPGGSSLGVKGWDANNPNNGYLHINDTTTVGNGHAVKIEAESDGTSGDNYGTLEMRNSNGGKIFADSRSMEFYGPSDSLSVVINNTGASEGNIGLYDSLGVSKGFMRGQNNGGYLQLQQLDASGGFQSAFTAGASGSDGFMNLFGQNTAQTSVTNMITNYITDRSIANGPVMGGNYRRSGTDWKDNNGVLLAAVGNAQDSNAAPGASGYLSLWGTESFNVELTGKRWENNNLPVFTLYGQNDDGGGWWNPNAILEVIQGSGTSNYTNFSLFSTDNGGVNVESAFLTSSIFGNTKAGGLILKDSLGNQTVELNGENGIGVFANAAIGQPGSGGFVHLYGDDTTGIDNLRTQLEVRPDGSGSSYGALELRGSNYNSNVILDGSNGSVTLNNNTGGFQTIYLDGVSGDITANNIFGNLQTPDGNDFFLRYGDATPFVSATPSNGRFVVNNPTGGQAARLFSGGFDGNFGRFRLYGNDNETHLESGVRDDNTGYTEYYGADNVTSNITVSVGSKPGFVESGEILLNNNGTTRVRLDGQSGEIFADTIDAININYTGSLNGPSDKRLKKNIENLNGALFNITRLNGVSFNWNATAKNEMGIVDEKQQIGVIAQELEKVYPQLVKTNEEGFKTVNYVSLTAVLLEAIKELNNKVITLETENEDLKTQLTKTGSEEIDKLKDEIAEIKALIYSSSNLGQ